MQDFMLVATLLAAASPPQAPASAAATSSVRTCNFAVNGKVRVNGRCLVFPLGGTATRLIPGIEGSPARRISLRLMKQVRG
jgi:hypothetical protein